MTEQTKPTDPEDSEKDGGGKTAQSILDFGSAMTRTPHGTVYCLTVIGQIEGHSTAPNTAKTTKYEHVLPLLSKLEESDEVDGVLFLLNTVGGDVEAGLAIAELIASMTKPTVSIVLGGSHSIGVPLAVAAKRSFAVPSAAMTIHPVRMSGTVIAAPQTYNYFQRLQDRIVAFVSGLLEHMDSAADVRVYEAEKGRYKVILVGDRMGQLIGHRGETLDAIQQLTNYAVNTGTDKRIRVQMDAENYRARREQSLESLARKVASKVQKYRRSVTLEPMNAYERHVIHAALQDVPGVTTYSVGTEPNRRVVVSYDRAQAR